MILPSDDYEDRTLDRSDIDTPLFPDDIVKTGPNGAASVEFSDESETILSSNQTWSLVYHNGDQKEIQDFALPVIPGWYYVVAHSAFSAPEQRIPQATLFDAHTAGEEGQPVDTLPTALNLNFDTPTEIDFQQYFPLESITKVEVTGLPESFWRQLTATKILFQTSQEDQSMTLWVTNKRGIVSMYTLDLITQPAQLAIANVDSKKTLTGTISEDTILPVTIQSFINNTSWTLSPALPTKDKTFTTSFASVIPEWNISYTNTKAFAMKRDTGTIAPEAGIVFTPDIKV